MSGDPAMDIVANCSKDVPCVAVWFPPMDSTRIAMQALGTVISGPPSRMSPVVEIADSGEGLAVNAVCGRQVLRGHDGPVSCCAFDAGSLFCSGSEDGSFKLYPPSLVFLWLLWAWGGQACVHLLGSCGCQSPAVLYALSQRMTWRRAPGSTGCVDGGNPFLCPQVEERRRGLEVRQDGRLRVSGEIHFATGWLRQVHAGCSCVLSLKLTIIQDAVIL